MSAPHNRWGIGYVDLRIIGATKHGSAIVIASNRQQLAWLNRDFCATDKNGFIAG
jgi:hypothetical protein